MTEERDKGDVTQDHNLTGSERRQLDSSSRNSSRGQNDQGDAHVACSNQNRRNLPTGMSTMNYPTNSNLTTPMCWTKHAALLGDMIGVDTSAQVIRWSSDQVADFLTKFGINKLLIEKFKQEVEQLFFYFHENFFFLSGHSLNL